MNWTNEIRSVHWLIKYPHIHMPNDNNTLQWMLDSDELKSSDHYSLIDVDQNNTTTKIIVSFMIIQSCLTSYCTVYSVEQWAAVQEPTHRNRELRSERIRISGLWEHIHISIFCCCYCKCLWNILNIIIGVICYVKNYLIVWWMSHYSRSHSGSDYSIFYFRFNWDFFALNCLNAAIACMRFMAQSKHTQIIIESAVHLLYTAHVFMNISVRWLN